jgi:threonyl-tRNA synthetase
VLGDQEVESKTATVRDRKGNSLGAMSVEEILQKLLLDVATKKIDI